jgi:phosphate transport system substrate-binding protein
MRKVACLLFCSTLLAGAAMAQGVLINAAGASFPNPVYQKWFNEYQKKTGVRINYQSVGSGAGIGQITEGTVDFGASDGPMNAEQTKKFRSKRGFDVLHFPTVMGAVVVTYNVPGVSQALNFTPAALAGIYLGRITKWNDAEIVKANPGVKLPGNSIVVVHRSDGSGTTYVFTDYLSKANADWKSKVGSATSVTWPVGLGAAKNDGVAGLVKQTANSVGYVELIYAVQNKMTYGNVKNKAGAFVKASSASVSAAAAASVKTMPEDFKVSITDAEGKASYPISTFTWLLIPQKIQDGNKRAAIVNFLKWMVEKDAQALAESLDYASLPKPVVAKELKAIAKVQ